MRDCLLTNLAEYVGEDARFVHQGMTSSDVLDTTLAVQLTKATDLLMTDLDELCAALKARPSPINTHQQLAALKFMLNPPALV